VIFEVQESHFICNFAPIESPTYEGVNLLKSDWDENVKVIV